MEMPGHKKRLWELIFFLLLFGGVLWISAGIHQGKGYYNWQSEIWGDKAGYYIYLPATLYYHYNLDEFPPNIDERTGNGFRVDKVSGKLYTKYTCGVALMISPFFVGTHYITKIYHIPQDWGFAPIYHRMTGIAAVFYLVLGLWFLKRFLENYLKEPAVYIALLFLLFGTNLLYYSTTEPLMSHVYSFFLFSALLFFMKKFTGSGHHYTWFLLMSISSALIILVRPVNIIVLPVLLFWDINSKESLFNRFRLILNARYLVPFLVILIMVFTPQMIYWKYSTGSYLYYPYGTEGFTNWSHPYMIEFWFSTMNGWFLYTPVAFFFIIGIVYMIREKTVNGILLGCLFLGISYIFASWNSWFFGCGFGQRSMVEFYSLLALPFGFVIQHAIDRWKKVRYLGLWVFLLGFTWYNVNFSYNYTGCFEGSVWDFNKYQQELSKAGLFPPFRLIRGFSNDFENFSQRGTYFVMDTLSRSGKCCMLVNPDPVNYVVYNCQAREFAPDKLGQEMDVSFWAYTIHDTAIRALITCSLNLGKVNLATATKVVSNQIKGTGKWYPVKETFELPSGLNQFTSLKVSVRNHGTENYFIDDLRIRFK